MADSPDKNKLPRLPKVHGSLPKLPTFGKKPDAAPVIPALSSKATQLPGVSLPVMGDDDCSETEAIAQPTPEAIEKALAEMRAKAGKSLPVDEQQTASGGASAPVESSASEAASGGISSESLDWDSVGSGSSSEGGLDWDDLKAKTDMPDPLSVGISGLMTPSGAALNPGTAQPASPSFGGMAQPASPSFGGMAQPASPSFGGMAQPALNPGMAQPASPSFGGMAQPALNPGMAQPASPSFGGMAQPASPSFGGMAQPAPAMTGADDSDNIIGGAAAEADDSLRFEDEAPDDMGEKTMMISEMGDDLDELDEENQKTQINMAAMDFDPLSGKLIVESGKTNQREYILVRDKTTIGRVAKNDIAISDISMSRHHADIDKFREGFRLRDLDSANGTLLNGYRIRVAQLRDGDIIELGAIRFRFEQSGGDPDELWKGEPKIEYHPNQKNAPKAQGAAPMVSNAPSASYGQGMSSPHMSIPAPAQPQMESMLERQGGGLAAAQWGGASPMTSPYMMGYGPNALRSINTTPVWSTVLLIVLGISCLGSVIWFVLVAGEVSNSQAEYVQRKKIVEHIELAVKQGISAYGDSRFNDAIDEFAKAVDADKNHVVIDDKDIEFFENYRKLINQEDDIFNEIEKIRKNINFMNIEECEDAIEFLAKIPADSVNYKQFDSANGRVIERYKRVLKNGIRDLAIREKKINEARELLVKLSTLPDTASEVSSLSKFISDEEKTKK